MAIPPRRQAEIDQIEDIYSAALAAIGIDVVTETLDLWEDIPSSPGQIDRHLAKFIEQVNKVTGLRRKHARQLAVPYYRLIRALATGHTIQAIDTGGLDLRDGNTVTLDDLREDFYDIAKILTPEAIKGEARSSGNASVPVEQIPDLQKTVDGLEKQQAEIHNLDQHRDAALTSKNVKSVSTRKGREAKVVDDEREAFRRAGGARAAAKAHMSTLDGARETVDHIAEKDPRAIGWIRYSTTGTPCGFCAMLIARGLVQKGEKLTIGTLYKSERTAEHTADDEKYHPNCKCRSIPVFEDSDIDHDPRFELNRRYARLWPTVTANLSGKEALSAWRKYFRANPEEVSARAQVA